MTSAAPGGARLGHARGRPQASSRETLADAACELFLEQGYEATAVSDITQRAGVSRSTFFNYFDGKAATIWFALDALLGEFGGAVAATDSLASSLDALRGLARSLGERPPHTLALAISNAEVMGVEFELQTGRALRQAALMRALSGGPRRSGGGAEARAGLRIATGDPVHAEILAAALAAAVFAGLWRWAELGAGTHRLDAIVEEALEAAAALVRPTD